MRIIVNPLSGRRKKEALVCELSKRLSALGSVNVFYTKAPKHATQLAQQAIDEGVTTVAVVGGDGTVNEVAQALVGTSVALGIIPTGSGNGLARHLHIPLDFLSAIAVLQRGHIRVIDTFQVNERRCIAVSGVGFDAEVGWRFAKSPHRGFITYFLSTLKELPRYRSCHYALTLDGRYYFKEAFLICFANSSQFGNGAVIAPLAKIDDGFLDVVIVKPFPLYAAIPIFYRLFHNSLHQSRFVEIIRCKEIQIAQPNLKTHVDGEPVFFKDAISIRIHPNSLRMVV